LLLLQLWLNLSHSPFFFNKLVLFLVVHATPGKKHCHSYRKLKDAGKLSFLPANDSELKNEKRKRGAILSGNTQGHHRTEQSTEFTGTVSAIPAVFKSHV